MHLLFKKGRRVDKSPFQYGMMAMLEARVLHYQHMYESTRKEATGRIEGNRSILTQILTNITEEFTGDLSDYMRRVDRVGTDLSRTLGLVSNYGEGKLFNSTLYPGCNEIFIQARNEDYMWSDLWYSWRTIPSVTVVDHPFTDLTYFEPGVTNPARVEGDGLAIFHVDIALLYIQWQFFMSSNPGVTVEFFLTSVVYPNMMKSHMDIVMFNRVMLRMGLIKECKVTKSNLMFNQQSLDQEMDRIVDTVLKNIDGRRLTYGQMVSAVPSIFGEDYLSSTDDPGLMPTIQSMWVTLAMRFKRLAYILYLGRKQGWANMTTERAVILRSIIRIKSDKQLSPGGPVVQAMFEEMVLKHIPESTELL